MLLLLRTKRIIFLRDLSVLFVKRFTKIFYHNNIKKFKRINLLAAKVGLLACAGGFNFGKGAYHARIKKCRLTKNSFQE